MTAPTYAQIEQAERDLLSLRWAYLKRWGWEHTCHNPGSYWLWRRDWTSDDEAALARWHERNAKREAERIEHGHPYTPNSPTPPQPYGMACVPMDIAIQMTLRTLDDRPELGDCDD
jgi:hypothetical protein